MADKMFGESGTVAAGQSVTPDPTFFQMRCVDGQGIAFLWSEDGELLATASQSIGVRLWPEDAVLPR